MLKNSSQKNEQIEKKLQSIHMLIARAICPLLPIEKSAIKRAKEQYNDLLTHRDAKQYDFLSFEDFCSKVQKMGADVFYQFITNTEEEFSKMKFSSYSTVAPANAFVHNEGKAGKHFEKTVFEQMDVIDVINNEYSTEPHQSHMVEVVSISDTVGTVEANIVALSESSGLSLGTGMLIRPRLVLTARHCIEDSVITQLNVHLNFQKSMDGSITIPRTYMIQGIVEEDLELDYAILLLNEKVEGFVPANVDISGNQLETSIFIHHPGGWVKKVSVHLTFESPIGTKSIVHSSFHDSMKGSSGGVYIDANHRICAIHLLNTEGATYARYMHELYQKSNILKRSFDGNGKWLGVWVGNTERTISYRDEETYWDTTQKRQDVFYSFYEEGAKPLLSQINPTKKELKQIIDEIDSMTELRTQRRTESGYRRDIADLTGRAGWSKCEVQKDGVRGKTTVAQVAYANDSLDEAQDLNIVKVGLKISLERGYSITIEPEDLTQLVLNKDNTAELTRCFESMIDTEITAQSNPPKKAAKAKKKGSYEYSSLKEELIEYWLSYEEEAIENILNLRLKSEVDDIFFHTIKITKAKIIDKSNSVFTLSQVNLLTREITKIISFSKTTQSILVPILIEQGELLYHWVGIVIIKRDSALTINYLDSENQLAPSIIEGSLVYKLQNIFSEFSVLFKYIVVEQQRYNNCGLELIENFVNYISGSRLEQEVAPYLHSEIYLQAVILDFYEQSHRHKNSVKLATLNEAELQREDIIYLDNYPALEGPELTHSISNFFIPRINKLLFEFSYYSWQFKKCLYSRDIAKFDQIMQKYNIARSADELIDAEQSFYSPSIDLEDKELESDVIFVASLKEKLSLPIGTKEIEYLQPLVYKANIGIKVTDTTVDVARLVYMPTVDNAQKTLMDIAHVYSMYTGINGLSLIPVVYEAINEYPKIGLIQTIYKVGPQFSTTLSYMLLPTILDSFGIPHIGFAYSVGLTTYTGYHTVLNAHSFYYEFNQKDFTLSSNMAYQALAEKLSTTYLQNFYDFTSKAKEYEKSACKIRLEEKGEFGQKLYEHIYSRVIEEKYDLQNNLRAKHIKVIDYDHCMEILELKEEDSDHYYCYNEELQILDHIMIVGEFYINKLHSL